MVLYDIFSLLLHSPAYSTPKMKNSQSDARDDSAIQVQGQWNIIFSDMFRFLYHSSFVGMQIYYAQFIKCIVFFMLLFCILYSAVLILNVCFLQSFVSVVLQFRPVYLIRFFLM